MWILKIANGRAISTQRQLDYERDKLRRIYNCCSNFIQMTPIDTHLTR